MSSSSHRRLLSAAALAICASAVLAACGGGLIGASSPSEPGNDPEIADKSAPAVSFAPRGHQVLPKEKLLVKSALGVDLTNHSMTFPLHKGQLNGKTVWYILTESSDFGLAHDLDLNFSPKLANMGIGCPQCVQDVTIKGSPKNKFGEGIVQFEGAPNFTPTRKLVAGPASGPNAFPPANATPGAIGDAKYSPFIRIKGSSVVYNAPIIASGDGPNFDVERHTDTADRVLSIKMPPRPEPGKSASPTVEVLLVRGQEADEKIFYLSTEASTGQAAAIERATFAPVLQKAPFVGGDDNLGAARERIFIFANGQTGARNPQAQGLSHLIVDGHGEEDASLKNTALISALRDDDGDAQNILGDFPSLDDPRHANAYSPLWDAQVGEWSAKAVRLGLNKRMTDENRLLNLVATRPDLITGPNGAPYGSVGFVINCPTVAFQDEKPAVAAAVPLPGGQF